MVFFSTITTLTVIIIYYELVFKCKNRKPDTKLSSTFLTYSYAGKISWEETVSKEAFKLLVETLKRIQ